MPKWIQCPKTNKLIPAEEYGVHEQIIGESAYVHEDIKPFKSPIDGSVIGTRADLRIHNIKHGVTDQRDYGPNWFERKAKERQADMQGTSKKAKQQRIDDIQRSMYQHGLN